MKPVSLDYEIEAWNSNGTSYVWVRVPELVDSNTCIWATWGDGDESNQLALHHEWGDLGFEVWRGLALFSDGRSDGCDHEQ